MGKDTQCSTTRLPWNVWWSFTASHDQIHYKTHIYEVDKEKADKHTHTRARQRPKDRRTSPKTTHSCINKLFIQLYFCTYCFLCFSTMHLFTMLPCLVKKKLEKHYLYYSDNILWSVFLLISILCSNIFSHAAIGQLMRHKKKEMCLFWNGHYAICMQKKKNEE